jgi:hypothetical protein
MRDLTLVSRRIRERVNRPTGPALFRALPVTITLTTVIVSADLMTRDWPDDRYQRLLGHLGSSYAEVRDGRIWHLFTGSLIQSSPGIDLSMVALIVCALTICELLAGSWRTLVTFFVADWLSTALALVALRLLAGAGHGGARSLLAVPDAGSSSASYGCLAAAAVLLPAKLAVYAYVLLLGFNIGMLFTGNLDAGIGHVMAVMIGGALGTRWRRDIVSSTVPLDAVRVS